MSLAMCRAMINNQFSGGQGVHGTAIDPAATPEPTEVCRTTAASHSVIVTSISQLLQRTICSWYDLVYVAGRIHLSSHCSDLVELVNCKLKLNPDAGSVADGGTGRFKIR